MSAAADLDYLTVVGMVGSKALTYAVDNTAWIIIPADHILIPEPAELPARLVEWVERIGTLVHHGVPVHVYYVSNEFTDYVLTSMMPGTLGAAE